MRLSIFYRLNLGYLVIILAMGAVSAYTVIKLHQVNNETKQILVVDERLLTLKNKLADSILSQLEYRKKYRITKDSVFHDQSHSAQKDFDAYLKETEALADSAEKKEPVDKVRNTYQHFLSLSQKTGETLSLGESHFGREEERLVEAMLWELKKIENSASQDIAVRMGKLNVAAGNALRLATIMFIIAVVLVIVISLVSTRSITGPLRSLIEKTDEVSRGLFEGDLDIASPPEISEVAKAINIMCDRLKEVDTMKSDFFSMMSHELRTPLASIKEGISLLRSNSAESNSARRERILTILSEEANRLINMVNRLLDLSKMEAGMMPYQFTPDNLVPLIDQVIIELTPLTETRKLQIYKKMEQDVPRLNIDREQILQALRNLVGNAVKFCNEGGQITITIINKGKTVECSIHDTGPGIPAESLKIIFEKFHQSSSRSSGRVKGTGLGLALVSYIIKAHGGTVWAESEIGQGSTFTFALPVL